MSAATFSLQQQQQHEVRLAVYDLSQGMARVLSAQFLGGLDHAIDIVPHTGIVVYGKEYFFGGGGAGVSAEPPDVFRSMRGISPVQILALGTTTVSQEEFEDWCVRQMMDGERKYSSAAYNLFHNNCNNFSNDAALRGLRLTRGVPTHLLEVPHKVLRSPMGQMMQPMLQGMQVSGGNSGLMIPVPTGQGGVGHPRSSSTDQDYNPWADGPSTTQQAASNPKDEAKKLPPTPHLDSNSRPLLSNDTKSAKLCVTKFDDKAIQEAARLVANNKPVSPSLLERTYDALLIALRNEHQITFSLLLLRLLVLQQGGSDASTRGCLDWVRANLIDRSDRGKLESKMARSMAWCCLSNATAAKADSNEVALNESLLEAALVDMLGSSDVGTSAEVKQASSGFLYNHTLLMEPHGEGLSDTAVSLLCSCLDGIDEATIDGTTRHRRLLIVGRLLARLQSSAARLMVDLGFDQVLRGMHKMEKDGDLVKEILALMVYYGG